MRLNVKLSAVCLVLLLGMLSMTTFGSNKDRTGTAGAQELLIPVGARGVALGLNGSLFSSGVDAIYWNPAGLARMDNSVQVMFSQMSYIADINVSYGAVGVVAGDFGTIGIALKSISFGDIQETTTEFPDGTGSLWNPTFLTLGATYSKALTDRIGVGITGNILSEQIMQMNATGLSFDVGVQYRDLAIRGLQLAVAIKHIGPNMKFNGSNAYVDATAAQASARGSMKYTSEMASFELPSSMEIGIGYSPVLDELNGVTVGATFINNNYLQDEYSVGAEYKYNNMFFVRGGYTFSPQTTKDINVDNVQNRAYIYDFTAGAGIKYKVGGIDLSFDYGFRNVKYLSGNHVFTLGVGF